MLPGLLSGRLGWLASGGHRRGKAARASRRPRRPTWKRGWPPVQEAPSRTARHCRMEGGQSGQAVMTPGKTENQEHGKGPTPLLLPTLRQHPAPPSPNPTPRPLVNQALSWQRQRVSPPHHPVSTGATCTRACGGISSRWACSNLPADSHACTHPQACSRAPPPPSAGTGWPCTAAPPRARRTPSARPPTRHSPPPNHTCCTAGTPRPRRRGAPHTPAPTGAPRPPRRSLRLQSRRGTPRRRRRTPCSRSPCRSCTVMGGWCRSTRPPPPHTPRRTTRSRRR